MSKYADLEIGLHRHTADTYTIDLRYAQPDSDVDNRLLSAAPTLSFDFEALKARHADDDAYGTLLTESLFVADVRHAFDKALVLAQNQSLPLRVRLFIGPSASDLHRLRWETLQDPRPDVERMLLTSDQIFFSRYLSSRDWRPVRLRPKTDLKALVVIANPTNLESKFRMAPVNVSAELERAKTNLDGVEIDVLASEGRATLENISFQLRNTYDILYLVCHGTQNELGEPYLWLEDGEQEADIVAGEDFISQLQGLQTWPRLIVLASCQSAGSGDTARTSDDGALSAFGPRLAEVGVPAVIAMQGNITMRTVAEFMPRFFNELQQDGQIDRAMSTARSKVQHRRDWWMPVLYMRLKSGRLWYVPGFAGDSTGLQKWPALINNIRRGRCTPILGMGLMEPLLGSSREIAQRWAETHQFPMAPHERDDLPQVAQYLAVNQEYMYPRDSLVDYLKEELLERYGDKFPDQLQGASLNELIEAVVKLPLEHNPLISYETMAELPLPIYITTDPGNLLESALRAADKEPQVELCRWNKTIEFLPSIYDDDPNYRPTPTRPMVYQLFGSVEELDSLVLTEDDYFDFLIGVTSNNELIPAVVRRKLVDAALIFLGFRLDDWDFRVLFRSIMSREGQVRRSRYAHVAVQINPEEGRIIDVERARRYLEDYFQGSDISIYWGTAEDFIRELKQQWDKESQNR